MNKKDAKRFARLIEKARKALDKAGVALVELEGWAVLEPEEIKQKKAHKVAERFSRAVAAIDTYNIKVVTSEAE